MAASDLQEDQKIGMKAIPTGTVDVESVVTAEVKSQTEKKELPGLADLDGIKRSWDLRGLIVIWASALLLSFATNLNNQTANSFAPYATSSFASAPLLGTIIVVQAVASSG